MSPTSVARWGQQNCAACGRRSNFTVAPRSKFKAAFARRINFGYRKPAFAQSAKDKPKAAKLFTKIRIFYMNFSIIKPLVDREML